MTTLSLMHEVSIFIYQSIFKYILTTYIH